MIKYCCFIGILISYYINAQYYTESEIKQICSQGNADSNPPSLSPGNDTIDFINKFKRKNYMRQYYGPDTKVFAYDDRVKYAFDITPWCVFLYFFAFGIIFWSMYVFCICCKCCYCFSGPATKIQSKRRLACPWIILMTFGLFSLVLAPYSIFYSNNLETNFYYQLCVTSRWSEGYFYGYDNWGGLTQIQDLSTQFEGILSDTAASMNSTLYKYYHDPKYEISSILEDSVSVFDSFIEGVNIEEFKNPNSDFSSQLPSGYKCEVCKNLSNYVDSFSTEVYSLTDERAAMMQTVDDSYSMYINKNSTIIETVKEQISWLDHLTYQYHEYESHYLKMFKDLADAVAVIFGYNMAMLGLAILLTFCQALAGFMIWRQQYKWRTMIHINWCCHSLMMSFFFSVGGIMLVSALVVSEGCEIFADVIQENKFYLHFDLPGGAAIGYCYFGDGDFPDFINLTDTLTFVDTLLYEYENTTSMKWEFEFPSLNKVNSLISDSSLKSYLSVDNSSDYWHEDDEINFFLFSPSNLYYKQSDFANIYTDATVYQTQINHCGYKVLTDYWVYLKESCPSTYVYSWGVSTTDVTQMYCYALHDAQENDIKSRYTKQGFFSSCTNVNTNTYPEMILQLLYRANSSWSLQTSLVSDQYTLKNNTYYMNSNITSFGEKMTNYNNAINAAMADMKNLKTKMENYLSTMNCSDIYSLTQELYTGFCGEFIYNLFDLSLYIGSLGICQMFLSLSAILILFRYRSDLEIEQEKILRTIGDKKRKVSENDTELPRIDSRISDIKRRRGRDLTDISATSSMEDITSRTDDSSSIVLEAINPKRRVKIEV
ncbi:unnamed protein product [Blepharisma stoltei]|uniref:Uncharacterized protein n=1 Tax=Blepharisma stoltei TaxID=1481888 RepID=A0AAU9K8V5_9CILI|nr:unnamed protein product [Blepharisma stoltei]